MLFLFPREKRFNKWMDELMKLCNILFHILDVNYLSLVTMRTNYIICLRMAILPYSFSHK